MSKKDFELIASVLARANRILEDAQRPDNEKQVVAWLTENFAEALQYTNPRFDYARFMEASK